MGALAAAGAAGLTGCATASEKKSPKFYFGACRGIDQAEKMKAAGFDFVENSVLGLLMPDKSAEEFKPQLDKLLACPLPIRSCNGFLPGTWKLTGPTPDHEHALAFAETACRRADQVGIKFIVFGSGAARNAPKDFDIAKARAQFIDFTEKLADRIAGCRVTIVLEPLNKKEANFLNTVAEGIGYVDEIDKPRIRLLADMFHMRMEGEPADDIRKAGARLLHCHIAEKEKRMMPGTKGEDFADYFKALRDIGYVGGVSCECGWPKDVPIEDSYATAVAYLHKQAGC